MKWIVAMLLVCVVFTFPSTWSTSTLVVKAVPGAIIIVDEGTPYQQVNAVGDDGVVTLTLSNGEHVITVSTTVNVSDSSKYVFTYWSMCSSRACGVMLTNSSITVTLPDDDLIEAHFILKHRLRVRSKPIKSSIYIDGVEYETPFEEWYGENTPLNIEAKSIVNVNGVVFTFKNFTGSINNTYRSVNVLVSRPLDIVTYYSTSSEYANVSIKILDNRNNTIKNVPVTLNGQEFKNVKELILPSGVYNITLPVSINTGNGKYVFKMWSDQVTSNSRTMQLDGDVLINAFYTLQHSLKAIVLNTPLNVNVYVNGVSYNVNPGLLTAITQVNDGLTITIDFTRAIEEDNGVRYVYSEFLVNGDQKEPPVTLTVNNSVNLKVTYRAEYYVKVKSKYGVVSGSGWYAIGSKATISIDRDVVEEQGVKHVFNGWIGVNSKSKTIELTIYKPMLIEALWINKFLTQLVFTDDSGKPLTPNAIILEGGRRIECSEGKIWLEEGVWVLKEVYWSGVNVYPPGLVFTVNKPQNLTIRCHVGSLVVKIFEGYGKPLNNTNIDVVLPNSTTLRLKTDQQGFINIPKVPYGNITVKYNGETQTVQFNGKPLEIILNINTEENSKQRNSILEDISNAILSLFNFVLKVFTYIAEYITNIFKHIQLFR